MISIPGIDWLEINRIRVQLVDQSWLPSPHPFLISSHFLARPLPASLPLCLPASNHQNPPINWETQEASEYVGK